MNYARAKPVNPDLAIHSTLTNLSSTTICRACLIGAGGWIRTIEAHASDLQSDPFGRSGTPAACISASLSPLRSTTYTRSRCQMELARGIEPPTG